MLKKTTTLTVRKKSGGKLLDKPIRTTQTPIKPKKSYKQLSKSINKLAKKKLPVKKAKKTGQGTNLAKLF